MLAAHETTCRQQRTMLLDLQARQELAVVQQSLFRLELSQAKMDHPQALANSEPRGGACSLQP